MTCNKGLHAWNPFSPGTTNQLRPRTLHQGLLTYAQLHDAIAISQASPGPLGMYVVVVGYSVLGVLGVLGVPGAVVGALALATPAPLAIPIARLALRRQSSALQGACSGIVIALCGLMVVTAFG